MEKEAREVRRDLQGPLPPRAPPCWALFGVSLLGGRRPAPALRRHSSYTLPRADDNYPLHPLELTVPFLCLWATPATPILLPSRRWRPSITYNPCWQRLSSSLPREGRRSSDDCCKWKSWDPRFPSWLSSVALRAVFWWRWEGCGAMGERNRLEVGCSSWILPASES
jgi:hypothetical protein